MIKSYLDIWRSKRWKTKKSIVVPWPSGIIDVQLSNHIATVFSSDPNDHFRPWLEANVGQQGKDWQWDMHPDSPFHLQIFFAKGKESYAVQASLMWNG